MGPIMSAPVLRRPKADLTGKQRSHLRGLAHHLDPVVQVGKDGVTPALVAAVQRALDDHELIKVRVLEAAPQDRREVAPLLAEATGAHVVGQVGRLVLLYRMPKRDPRIRLPTR